MALIQSGTNHLIGVAVFQDAVNYVAGTNLGPAIYDTERPASPVRWVELTDFVAYDPPVDIAVLGWTLPDGTPLSTATIPDGQGGTYFKVCHP